MQVQTVVTSRYGDVIAPTSEHVTWFTFIVRSTQLNIILYSKQAGTEWRLFRIKHLIITERECLSYFPLSL